LIDKKRLQGFVLREVSMVREAGDVSALPGSLDCVRVPVLADVRHRLTSGYAVDHCHAGECGAGPSAAAVARDLYPLCGSTTPGFVQRVLGVAAVRG
jgi:hypothetical protein